MSNPTQFERYQRLLEYIDNHIDEDLTPEKIESLCFYSYRNINRIFHSLNNETIGQYIKRLRMEKAAEYLKYSGSSVADIALSVGFSDTASFSKAFKKAIGCSPSHYRDTASIKKEMQVSAKTQLEGAAFTPLDFELVKRAEQQVVYNQYRGSYSHFAGIEEIWKDLISFAVNNDLLNSNTVYFAEILDDNDITSSVNCRYNALCSIDEGMDITGSGAIRTKSVSAATYAKFVHKGSHASSVETYKRIYSQWMHYSDLELADRATLEVYVNDDGRTPESDLITEIYIPVIDG